LNRHAAIEKIARSKVGFIYPARIKPRAATLQNHNDHTRVG
jgi:hypothetical protein